MKTTNVDGHSMTCLKNTTHYLDLLRLGKTTEITLNMANLQHGQQSIVFLSPHFLSWKIGVRVTSPQLGAAPLGQCLCSGW